MFFQHLYYTQAVVEVLEEPAAGMAGVGGEVLLPLLRVVLP